MKTPLRIDPMASMWIFMWISLATRQNPLVSTRQVEPRSGYWSVSAGCCLGLPKHGLARVLTRFFHYSAGLAASLVLPVVARFCPSMWIFWWISIARSKSESVTCQ